jgi:hypothetical protein
VRIDSIGSSAAGYEPDGITIGLNGSSELEVVNGGITAAKMAVSSVGESSIVNEAVTETKRADIVGYAGTTPIGEYTAIRQGQVVTNILGDAFWINAYLNDTDWERIDNVGDEVTITTNAGGELLIKGNGVNRYHIKSNALQFANAYEFPFPKDIDFDYKDQLMEAIHDVYLVGTLDSSKYYHLSTVARDNNTTWRWRLEIYVSDDPEGQVNPIQLCNFLTSDNPEIGGIQVHHLIEFSSSGIEAYVAIDWSKITNGNYLLSYNNLLQSVWQKYHAGSSIIANYLENLREGAITDNRLKHGGFISGSVPPSGAVTPDRIGQIYHDTSGGVVYISVGITNADWIQLSN